MSTMQSSVSRAPRPSSLADVLDLILDKGLVIDAYVRVSVVGIEILTIDARIVVASVDTYLRFAEAVNRLDLGQGDKEGLPDLVDDLRNRNGDRRAHERDEGGDDGDGASEDRHDERSAARTGARALERGRDGGDEDGGGERGLVGRLAQRGRWS